MFSLIDVKYKNILDIKSIHINEGVVTCILGESGSGKTTLLKLLNKLISADSGEILYKGKPIESVDSVELRREVVMLSQEPVIFEGSIRDNLNIGLVFSRKENAQDREIDEMLSKVKLNKQPDESPQNLSGGEKQRLALGRIMLMHPETLLLDEPSASLDEKTEMLVISALVEYAREYKKTLIMVTHAKHVAQKFADEIITIKDGRVLSHKEGVQ